MRFEASTLPINAGRYRRGHQVPGGGRDRVLLMPSAASQSRTVQSWRRRATKRSRAHESAWGSVVVMVWRAFSRSVSVGFSFSSA